MKPGDEFEAHGQKLFVVTVEDYNRLLMASEGDDTIKRCEVCGAWLDIDDPFRATSDDFEGCWKMATRRARDAERCRSYRVCSDQKEPTDVTS